MYSVSADYLTAIAKNARAHKLTGTVNGTSFDGGDIIRNSFSVKNQFCPATEIALGGVYVGELNLTFTEAFASSMNIRGSWKGKIITASIGVELADASFEYIPINGGSYIIETAQWTDTGIQIVAYDKMSLFDVSLPAIDRNVLEGSICQFHTNQSCDDLALPRATNVHSRSECLCEGQIQFAHIYTAQGYLCSGAELILDGERIPNNIAAIKRSAIDCACELMRPRILANGS